MSPHATGDATLTWRAPGPGSWELQADHFPRPVTPTMQSVVDVWSEATTRYVQDLGLPIREARMATVNGLAYTSFVSEGRQGAKPPPAWVMKLALRVVPSLRRTERRLAEVLDDRPWVAGVRGWYEEGRAAAIARMSSIAAVDPASLDDLELASHLRECQRLHLESAREHLGLHAHDQLPVLLFAVAAERWGLDTGDALALLAGASPASTGASPELEALREAVRGRPAATLAELRSLDPDVSSALDAFLGQHGWRLIDGYDVDGPCLAEVPSLVVRLATTRHDDGPSEARVAAVARARDRVPVQHRDEFDRALSEARSAYGLRDDNGSILVAWPGGLLRRALRAAGARLAGRGELDDPDLVIEAAADEVAAALEAVTPLDEAELARRSAFRRSVRAADAPRTLGPPDPPMPVDLPGAFGTVMRAFALETPDATARRPLHGLGVGSRLYEGRARLVTGAGRSLDAFQPGEVLVAPMTSPSYNVVLSLAGALVTEEGNAMSHAAIMARELGLPAVIGALAATSEIHDGDLVTVDPMTGTVRVHPPDRPALAGR
jgi:rifampicin phosphotransferase